MLLFFDTISLGVSSPELLSELDSVMSDPLDALRLLLNSMLDVVLLNGPSCETEKKRTV